MPEPARWFHLANGVQRGPEDLEAMRAMILDGRIGPDTYVWADGMPEWQPAATVPALTPPPQLRPAHWPAG